MNKQQKLVRKELKSMHHTQRFDVISKSERILSQGLVDYLYNEYACDASSLIVYEAMRITCNVGYDNA